MSKYQGTRTEKNLLAAFAGESQARNRYHFFAEQARQNGETELAEAFDTAAENEKHHAKVWFEALDLLQDSRKNVDVAVENEHEEAENMYIEFARVANSEGFPELAQKFEQIAAIERYHENKFTHFAEKLRDAASEFKKLKPLPLRRFMECKHCGNIQNTTAGTPCPVCKNIFE